MTLSESIALGYVLVSALLGQAYVIASGIAKFGRPEWRITQWCAKHASDIRDLRSEVGGLR